jgi:fibrillarin-like rRNA methylase
MFADDCLMFFRANPDQATVIKNAISLFEKGSGQLLSVKKCSLMFSENYPEANQQAVRQIMEVVSDTFEDRYLGYPTP